MQIVDTSRGISNQPPLLYCIFSHYSHTFILKLILKICMHKKEVCASLLHVRHTSVDGQSVLPIFQSNKTQVSKCRMSFNQGCRQLIESGPMYFVCVCVHVFFFRSNSHLTSAIPPLRVGQLNSHYLLSELSMREKNLRKMLEGKRNIKITK